MSDNSLVRIYTTRNQEDAKINNVDSNYIF